MSRREQDVHEWWWRASITSIFSTIESIFVLREMNVWKMAVDHHHGVRFAITHHRAIVKVAEMSRSSTFFEKWGKSMKDPRVCVLSTSLPSVFCIIISLPAEVDNYRPSMSDYSCHVICSMALNEILQDPDVLTPPYISLIDRACCRRHSCTRQNSLKKAPYDVNTKKAL